MHSDYTTIAKLILRASKKVNDRHAVSRHAVTTAAKALGLAWGHQPRRWQLSSETKMPAIARRHFGRADRHGSALLHHRANALFQRQESFLRRNGRDQLVIVPRIFRRSEER